MNSTTLMGRLVATPELRTTKGGSQVATFTLAINRPVAKEKQTADFIDCVAWKQRAEFICKYFKKGDMIAITGSIQTRMYEGKDGKNHKAVEILINNAEFTGGKGGTKEPDVETPEEDFSVVEGDEDLPF